MSKYFVDSCAIKASWFILHCEHLQRYNCICNLPALSPVNVNSKFGYSFLLLITPPFRCSLNSTRIAEHLAFLRLQLAPCSGHCRNQLQSYQATAEWSFKFSFYFYLFPWWKTLKLVSTCGLALILFCFKIKRVTQDLITKSIALPQYKEPLSGFKLTQRWTSYTQTDKVIYLWNLTLWKIRARLLSLLAMVKFRNWISDILYRPYRLVSVITVLVRAGYFAKCDYELCAEKTGIPLYLSLSQYRWKEKYNYSSAF
jgi:hypothetical protein